MAGGILLPGNATTAQVLAGKTFSSGAAGMNAVGTYVTGNAGAAQTESGYTGPGGVSGTLALPKGGLAQNPLIGYNQGNLSLSFPQNVSIQDSVVVTIAIYNTSLVTVSGISGLSASWSSIVSYSIYDENVEIWLATGCSGTQNAISVSLTGTPSGSYGGAMAVAYDVIGSLAASSNNSGQGSYLAISTPSNGVVFGSGLTAGSGSSTCYVGNLNYGFKNVSFGSTNTYSNFSGYSLSALQVSASGSANYGYGATIGTPALAVASFSVS